MPNDLHYFYESDLDKTNIKDFYDSLPCRLQDLFKGSTNAEIIWDNVLQGYRGPSYLCNGGSGDSGALESSCGIQEIKMWWGARKDINMLPVLGTLAFCIVRVVQSARDQLDWSSLYFDSKTGECLSHNKNEAAEKLDDKASQLFLEGKYVEAVEYHSNAYRFCSSGYRNEQTFKNNRDRAQAEIDAINLYSQGEDLFRDGNYSEAYSKYQEAMDKSQTAKKIEKYEICKNKAKAELKAIALKKSGDVLFNDGRYEGAKTKYQEAYNKSQVTKNKNKYAICKNQAKSELGAIGLKELGDIEFYAGRYDSAKAKYKEAYNKSQILKEKNRYAICKNQAKAELNAIGLEELGDIEFNAGRYDSAKAKYQEAYNKSQVTKEKNRYSICKNQAKAELNAIGLEKLGDIEFNAGRYDSAKTKYQEAYNKSQVTKEKNQYAICKNQARAELSAIGLEELGDIEFNAGRYDSAKSKYQEAYNKSQVTKEKNRYFICKNQAKAELNAIGLEELGDIEFNAGRYDSAKSKYQEAYSKSQVTKEKNRYAICKNHAKVELSAIGLEELGDIEFNAGRYDSAKAKYQEAYNKSQVTKEKNKYTICKNQAKAELNAIGLEELGDIEFNAGRYDSAKAKYQEAYNKSQVTKEKNRYAICKNQAEAELNAIGLKELGDIEFYAGRYDSAKAKYQEAYNESQITKEKNKYAICKNLAKTELNAIGLKELGHIEFNVGRYNSAKAKYREAYNESQITKEKNKYAICKNLAKTELNAIGLKELGDIEFNAGRYNSAKAKYREAYNKSQITKEKNKYTICKNQAKAELNAIGLEELGDIEFNAGRYDSAEAKYQEAYNKSQVKKEKNKYAICQNQAKAEIDAIGIKELGDIEFNAGRYDDAKAKYQEAYNKSQIMKEKNKYVICNNQAKVELEAIGLKELGDVELNAGRYDSAKAKYQEAYNKSQLMEEKFMYAICQNQANAELNAIELKELGDIELNAGRYESAKAKYQEAYNKSQIMEEKFMYAICQNQANAELNAIELKELGDIELNAGRYESAKAKYQEAYNKSQITKEKNIYAINKEKVETIIHELSILDVLWNKAWTAENDTENDRSDEAKESFQLVLNKSKENLKIFPDNLNFKKYKTVVSLKIEGNELFNQGHESQQNGIKLLQIAQELKEQQKIKLALKIFLEAKDKFSDAQEKFKKGSKRDERFLSCIEFVQEQLNEVIQSIEIIKTHTLNQRLQDLNINIGENDQNTNVYNSNITEEQHNYYEQI